MFSHNSNKIVKHIDIPAKCHSISKFQGASRARTHCSSSQQPGIFKTARWEKKIANPSGATVSSGIEKAEVLGEGSQFHIVIGVYLIIFSALWIGSCYSSSTPSIEIGFQIQNKTTI